MRTFLLAAMAVATVSCAISVPAPPAVSVGCYDTSVALSTPNVTLAESYIIQGGCQNFNFDITQCTKNVADNYRCDCVGTLSNTSSWEYAVRNISSGFPCFIDVDVNLVGSKVVNDDPPVEVELRASQTKYDARAFGGNCNTTEISTGLEGDLTAILGSLEYSSLNVNSSVTGVTWTSATVIVYACDKSSKLERSKQLTPGSTTTTPPTSPTPTNNATTSPPTSSTNSTSTPTTVSPVTPAPTNTSSSSSSSSSSSTGGKGTGTTGGNGASVMMHSATAVVVALISAAVTVIGAA